MFNVQGSELIFLVLIALLVLGPEKLPDAIRKFGRLYGEFRKIANGFQTEIRSALDEPAREIQKTADLMRNAATFDVTPAKPAASPKVPNVTTTLGTTTTAGGAPTTGQAPSASGDTPTAAGTPATEPEAARPALNFGNAAARQQATPADTSPPDEGTPS